MIVSVTIKVVSAFEQLLDLKIILLRVAEQTIDDAGRLDDHHRAEANLVHVNLLRVPDKVVELVNVDTIALIGNNFVHPLAVGVNWTAHH